MDEYQIRERLRSFITEVLLRDPGYSLDDEERMFTTKLIDSFALAELAVMIERDFNVYVPDSEMTSESMDTLNQIVVRVLQGIKEH